MSNEKATASAHGIGFFGLLAIVLITLKLLKQIEISWWIIVAVLFGPLWIALSVVFGGLIIVGIASLIGATIDYFKRK